MKKTLLLLFISLFYSIIYSAHNIPTEFIDSAGVNDIPALIDAAKLTGLEDIEIRIKAIQKLGELKAKEAVPVIIEALGYGRETIINDPKQKSSFWRVRVVSAKALADIGDSQAVKPLARTAFRDENTIVRRAAIQALGLMGELARTREVLDILYDMLERTKDNGMVADICEALGKIGDKSSFSYLLKVTQGPYLNQVKEIAQKAISKLNFNVDSVYTD